MATTKRVTAELSLADMKQALKVINYIQKKSNVFNQGMEAITYVLGLFDGKVAGGFSNLYTFVSILTTLSEVPQDELEWVEGELKKIQKRLLDDGSYELVRIKFYNLKVTHPEFTAFVPFDMELLAARSNGTWTELV